MTPTAAVLLLLLIGSARAQGGLFASCEQDSDCLDQPCSTINFAEEIVPCPDTSIVCFCAAEFTLCAAASECGPDELCAVPPARQDPICMACDNLGTRRIVDPGPCVVEQPTPTPSTSTVVDPTVTPEFEPEPEPEPVRPSESPEAPGEVPSGPTVTPAPVDVDPVVAPGTGSGTDDGAGPVPSTVPDGSGTDDGAGSVPSAVPDGSGTDGGDREVPSGVTDDGSGEVGTGTDVGGEDGDDGMFASPSPVEEVVDATDPTAVNPTDPTAVDPGTDSIPIGDGTEEPTEEPICIDAEALSSFKADELVFPTHRRTAVLCDASNSCATPGHMVFYQGRGMMMRSYCEMAGCSRSVKAVNSPKFKRALRMESRTDGLHFTAFAARFETRAEEYVLKMVVHIGM